MKIIYGILFLCIVGCTPAPNSSGPTTDWRKPNISAAEKSRIRGLVMIPGYDVNDLVPDKPVIITSNKNLMDPRNFIQACQTSGR